jgi:Cu(I)/Ag(I) efflux system membrane protein CusA/SilA
MSDEQGGTASEGFSPIGSLIRFCLENKLVVFLITVFIIVWGIRVAPFDWQLTWLPRDPVPVDAIPDIGENQQIVFTQWMGRSPQDVDDQITYPLTTALLGISGVKTIRSSSMFGFSSIYVIFEEDVDLDTSRNRILTRLNSLPAGTMPEGVQPALGPEATALGQVYWYTLEGRDPNGNPTGGWDLEELRTIQDWHVRYSLLSAGGIAEVGSVGGFVREYQVDVDPDAMRAYGVTLDQVFNAVRMSNLDIGARTLELNGVEYVIRSLGFIESLQDLELTVVSVVDNVPIYVKDVAHVSMGPALRRGALDKEGAEAVGGVVVVRYGFNPLEAIQNVKARIAQIGPALPRKVVIDYRLVSREQVEGFARSLGFGAYDGAELNQQDWLEWLSSAPPEETPRWVTLSQVTIVPFYDRTGLIYETLGTLNTALSEEILVTIIVVILMVLHLRSSALISSMLPLAVLLCFIAMKVFGVDANIVALSGIAIAIGTIVDMGIVVCENILRRLDEADPGEDKLRVVFRAAHEVGSAVVTAVATTVVSFLPVFTMTGQEGKLFKPLAYTKTFALVASIVIALTIIPPLAHILLPKRELGRKRKLLLCVALAVAGLLSILWLPAWVGLVIVIIGAWHGLAEYLPNFVGRAGPMLACFAAVLAVGLLLAGHWLPLGPEKGLLRNFLFIAVLVGGLLGFFRLLILVYGPALRFCLAHKLLFLSVPAVVLAFGLYVWMGPERVLGAAPDRTYIAADDLPEPADAERLIEAGLLVEAEDEPGDYEWATKGRPISGFVRSAAEAEVSDPTAVLDLWLRTQALPELAQRQWSMPDDDMGISDMNLAAKARWTLARDWKGRGREFMPPLDEGSFLYMPTTMPHASIGEAMDVLSKQDMMFRGIPEVDGVVGKLGRADTPLDPAPVSMIETVINYKSEYKTDSAGHRMRYKFDPSRNDLFRDVAGNPVPAPDGEPYTVRGAFDRDAEGNLIEDPDGAPFRQWRPVLDPDLNPDRDAWPGVKGPRDIWDEITAAGDIPGTTQAPHLQPIAARIVMLQSGMRAPMGVKIYGPKLETIEEVGLQVERFLKEVPSVNAAAVNADRIVGKPYLEIKPDREAIARYRLHIKKVQDIIDVAIGGRRLTTTVEGRERYPVRVRYMRELRDRIDKLGRVLVSGPGGTQVPLEQVARIEYVRGPQAIKSEDTFLVGYVTFDKQPGFAEVDVVEQCRAYLDAKEESGDFVRPPGVEIAFAGTYEAQIRSRRTLMLILPLALFVIFMILYLQFRSVSTTGLVFSGIAVAWAGGFILMWLYAQPWFLDFSVSGIPMRELFQIHEVNLSVAVWVGFLALFGIASDNGVVLATYLDQSFASRRPESVQEVREATLAGAKRRIRPCLMTSATTILALIPVLTSTGRGADVMVPMAIPSFGGMLVVLVSVFLVPVLYCAVQEAKLLIPGEAKGAPDREESRD